MKNVGNSSDGRSQGVPKISGHPCIGRMGACAVIFAIAQLSCNLNCLLLASSTCALSRARSVSMDAPMMRYSTL